MILGAVIAGGRSRRFGSDKAVALLEGRLLIDHAIAALLAVTDEIVVCGRDWPGLTNLPDRPAPDLGPLGGINAALADAQARGFSGVVTIGCDMPGVPPQLLLDLIAACPAHAAEAPILGCWPAALASSLDRHLAEGGDRSIRRWARTVGAGTVDSAVPLANINTPSDLAAR
jgi:molybdopterin-guanine dinucleotide biosynthesis protein A